MDYQTEIEMLLNEVDFLTKENDLLREHYKELLELIKDKFNV